MHGMMAERLVETQSVSHADLLERSVDELCERFPMDAAQSRRVAVTVSSLYRQAQGWMHGDEVCHALLLAAARLHQIGMCVNPQHYHRHGGYIVKHAQLPGLSDHQRAILALLVRGHRRSLPGLSFQAFEPVLGERLLRMTALLRIAVILERSHDDTQSPDVHLSASDNQLQLRLPSGWLGAHPLSAKELEVETGQLATAGLELKVS